MADLSRLPVGILCADGVEQVEFTAPRQALGEAGFETELISPGGKPVRGYSYIEPGDVLEGDRPLDAPRAEDYSCLLIPGGLGGPDALRVHATEPVLVSGRNHEAVEAFAATLVAVLRGGVRSADS